MKVFKMCWKKWRRTTCVRFLVNNQSIVIWTAPVVWQVFYSLTTIWFGVAAQWGATFREQKLNMICHPPYDYLIIALGIYGLITSFLKFHNLHLIHSTLNLFLFSFIFLNYATNSWWQMQTTGVYGVLMLGAVWLAVRISVDQNILVHGVNVGDGNGTSIQNITVSTK
jgi:hypothetical protein